MALSTPVAEIPGIVATVRETYNTGVTRPLKWRLEQLACLRRLLEENEGAIAEALAKDLRKPKPEGVLSEVIDVLSQISYMQKNLHKLAKKKSLPTPLNQWPLKFEAWQEPLGVVTVIAPWNYPFSLVFSPLVGVIAAGNTCVMKPSEVPENCCALIAELVPKYLDKSAFRVVTGGVPETTALLAERVNHIMYTGGGAVGKIVMAAAAKHLTPITLELGGKSPAYVDESANIETSARRLVWTKNMNAGQTCVAPDHVLVHEKVRDEFLKQLKAERERLYPGDEQKNCDLSRIVSDRHFARVAGLLEGHGGQVFCGGNTVPAERFIEFTVVTDPSLDSPLMTEEIFGPILPVITVKSVDEAIAISTSRATPLAAYVFERNGVVREKWVKQVPSGSTCVNDCLMQIANVEGGLRGKGESGMGIYRGRFSFENFSHRKVVCYQAPNLDPLVKYPPYKDDMAMLKLIIMAEVPAWVKVTFWATVGAGVLAAATFLSKHVTVNVSLH